MKKNADYWYKDGVIYQVHIKAFRDSNADGKGDIAGITEKLDYIKSLGITVIWLLPFYPSPLKDDGYDIADYMNINPEYGTIDDFKKLINEAHKRGIRIITELVMNHTSDQHKWFQRARKSPPGSPERNFYVWNDTPNKYNEARVIFSDFESSNWSYDNVANSYFWHRFYSHQPDLNFENPEVHNYLLNVLDYWFELGVDGLRLDAVPYLYEREGTNCENLPETHAFLKKLNAHVQSKFKDKVFLAEANQWPEDAVEYFGDGDECQMAFHFPIMPRLYMALQMETRFPIIDIIEQTPAIPENCQWAMFLRNHDELTLEMVTDEERDYMYRYYAKDKTARLNLGIRRRLAPLVENNRRKIELLNILLFSFPGTPIIYYGDEIGMGDNYYLGDRHGVRTPMQWSADRNAGFSSANPQKLYLPVIIDPEYHYETVNVEVQQRNTSSLLWWMKKTIAFRNKHKAFGRGSIEFLSPANSKVLAFIRRYEDEIILVVANLSRFSQVVELDLSQFKGYTPEEVFSRNEFPPIGDLYYMLTLNAYDYYWFKLINKEKLAPVTQGEIPELEIEKKIEEIFEEDNIEILEDEILPETLKKIKVLSDTEKVSDIQLADIFLLSKNIFLFVIKINYLDKPAEQIFLFTGVADDLPYELNVSHPEEILSVIKTPEKEMYLVNCFYNNDLRKQFLKYFISEKTFPGSTGKIEVDIQKKIKNVKKDYSARILIDNNSFISFLINDSTVIKFYKKNDEGSNPEEEALKFLNDETGFNFIPSLSGVIKYNTTASEQMSVGVLTDYVRNEGDAWVYFSEHFDNYFEKLFVHKEDTGKLKFVESFFDEDFTLSSFEEFAGSMASGMASLLGRRTGELHLALSSSEENLVFKPEPVNTFYQRSVYQSSRSIIKSTFRILRNKISLMDDELNILTRKIISKEDELLSFIEKILKLKFNARKQRIHGNYNLQQILFTGKDFVITNFEGQASAAFTERKLKRSPLRDIASLIFSFHSLVNSRLRKQNSFNHDELESAEYYANQWWLAISRIFLTSYFKRLSSDNNNIVLQAEKDDLNYLLLLYLFEKSMSDISHSLETDDGMLTLKLKSFQQLFEHINHFKTASENS